VFFRFLSLIGGLERLGLRFFSGGGLPSAADEWECASALSQLGPEPIIDETVTR